MRKALFGLGVSLLFLPLLLVVWYVAAVRWAPMDALTIALPQAAQDPDSWSTRGRIAIQAGPNRDGRLDDLRLRRGRHETY